MRQYKIVNSDLWYKIRREDGERVERLDVKWGWNANRTFAKLFFHRDDAMSALVVVKRKWGKIDTTSNTTEKKSEKQSWSEF